VPKWDSLPQVIQYWLGIGVIIGVIAIVSYIKKIPLGSRYIYPISYLLYSLKTVLGIYIGILLWDVPNGLYAGIVISVGIWFVAVRYFGNKLPFVS